MQTFESAAELDKALEDGSFENIDRSKPGVSEKEEHPELALTPEEKEGMKASTDLLEAAQKLDRMAAEAQEKGFGGALYRAISERAAHYHVQSSEIHGAPAETREALVKQADQVIENFQFSLNQHEQARQTERIENAREDVDDVLEEVAPATAMSASHEVAPVQAAETAEVPLWSANQITDAFKDLSKEAKGRSTYVTKLGKTYAKSFAGKFKEVEKLNKKATTLEERNEARQQIRKDAEEQWTRLRNALDQGM